MKIIRYQDPQGSTHHACIDQGSPRKISGDLFGEFTVSEETADVQRILAPVVPAAVLCIGKNYREHAEETGSDVPDYPVLFMKTPTAVQDPGGPIQIPTALASHQVDYEGELAVVIGKTCKNVSRENALDVVLGYTCAIDVSARDWQKLRGGSQWCRGKTFDTFAPMGPCLVLRDDLPNPQDLQLTTRVNGEIRQQSHTGKMIFDVATLIEFLSGSTTLAQGTVILTGTPSGVGMAMDPPQWLKPGDTVSVEIDRIGTLECPVENEV